MAVVSDSDRVLTGMGALISSGNSLLLSLSYDWNAASSSSIDIRIVAIVLAQGRDKQLKRESWTKSEYDCNVWVVSLRVVLLAHRREASSRCRPVGPYVNFPFYTMNCATSTFIPHSHQFFHVSLFLFFHLVTSSLFSILHTKYKSLSNWHWHYLDLVEIIGTQTAIVV